MHEDTYTLPTGTQCKFTYPPDTKIPKEDQERFLKWVSIVTGKLTGDQPAEKATVTQVTEPATTKQLNGIKSLAEEKEIPLAILCAKFGVVDISDFNTAIADHVIKVLEETDPVIPDAEKDP